MKLSENEPTKEEIKKKSEKFRWEMDEGYSAERLNNKSQQAEMNGVWAKKIKKLGLSFQ